MKLFQRRFTWVALALALAVTAAVSTLSSCGSTPQFIIKGSATAN